MPPKISTWTTILSLCVSWYTLVYTGYKNTGQEGLCYWLLFGLCWESDGSPVIMSISDVLSNCNHWAMTINTVYTGFLWGRLSHSALLRSCTLIDPSLVLTLMSMSFMGLLIFNFINHLRGNGIFYKWCRCCRAQLPSYIWKLSIS